MTTVTYQFGNSANGHPLINLPTPTDEATPTITPTTDGNGFLAVWMTGNETIHARFGDLYGEATGAETDPSAGLTQLESEPAIATLHGGGYVVAFSDVDVNGQQVVGVRLLGADGQFAGPQTVLQSANSQNKDFDPDVTVLSDGRFAVTWTRWFSATDSDIQLALFNPDGSVIATNKIVNNAIDVAAKPSIAALEDGGFVTVWQSRLGAEQGVYFRRFDAAGNALDGSNTQGVLIDKTGANTDIQVKALPDGGFVVAYTDDGWQLSGTEISARVFNADGTPRSNAILVNAGKTPGDQDHASIAVLDNGFFAVSWSWGVNSYMKIFDTHGNAVTDVYQAAPNASETELVGLHAGLIAGVFESTDPDAGNSTAIRSVAFELTRTTTGTDAPDSLMGDALNETMSGGKGADTLEGRGGEDTLYGGDGIDTASYEHATAGVTVNLVDWSKNTGEAAGDWFFSIENLTGSKFSDTLEGDDGPNKITGGGGKDTLFGRGGDDSLWGEAGTVMYGNDGNDEFHGVGGNEIAYGGVGDDTYYDIIDAREAPGEGHDIAYSTLMDYVLPDNVEDLYLKTAKAHYGHGNEQDNRIVGNGFGNILEGRGGNDTLVSVGGEAKLDGGSGDDTAEYAGSINDYHVFDLGEMILLSAKAVFQDDWLVSIEHLKFADGVIDVNDGSALFDTVYYMTQNLDVFHSGANALAHFNSVGWHEQRDPNPFFDTSAYLAAYKDAAASGMNPLDHYDQIGWKLGYDPGPDFDTKYYLVHNPDVAAAGVDPLAHFLQFGLAEGRQSIMAIGQTIVNGFDAEYYLMHNQDVAAAGVDPLAHFMSFGWQEGRNPSSGFDTLGYLAHYGDVAAAGVNPLVHYETAGWLEGRDPSGDFDTLGYLAANPDVAAAHVNPLDHFMQYGVYEDRTVVSDGVWH